MIETNKIYLGDTLETIKTLPDKSVNSVITSPPYWQLRDYGYPEQWGLEPTYQEYLNHLWSLMDEIWRVLKDDGTVWINLGDSYGTVSGAMRDGKPGRANKKTKSPETLHFTQVAGIHKCLNLIPHRFAVGCIDRGWILRNDIIWAKRNGMPESVTDRFSKKHEYFFFMVKQPKYYFDLDGVRDRNIHEGGKILGRGIQDWNDGLNRPQQSHSGGFPRNESGKNPGDVSDFWDIPTQPSSDKHYATYNFDLIDKPIIAGCPKGGVILDPFCGTGTTITRAIQLDRTGIGIDGSEEYCKIAEQRVFDELKQLKLFNN